MLQKLDDMVRYCQLHSCRRRFLLKYFDEEFAAPCGSCDYCLTEFKKFDGTLIAQKALSAVARLKERFGAGVVVDFLRGGANPKITEEHKQLKTYGIGADISKNDWHRYIQELAAMGYLQFTDDVYPVIKLTQKSESVLKGQVKVELIESQTATDQQPRIALEYETELLATLKNLRRDMAIKENIPPYIILSDASLVEIATYLPQSLDELRLISGFGDVKLARYGREFSELVKGYSTSKGLSSRISQKVPKRERKAKSERSTRTVSKDLDTAYISFSLFRQGQTVPEIAAGRGLAATTIESHLSTYIYTGAIDITEMVADDKKLKIKDVVESYGADKL